MNLLKDISSLSDEELKYIDLKLRGFDEDPVDIETFIFDEYYLGNYYKGIRFSPHWIDFLNNLYEYKLDAPAFLIVLRGCLSASTKILLLSGEYISIKDIVNRYQSNNNSNISILAYDLHSNTFKQDRIINAFSTGIKDIYRITLDNGKYVECTSNHTFLNNKNIWVSIDKGITKYTRLKSYNNHINTVINIEYIDKQEVYDITTEKYHNFTIDCGLISHNSIGRSKTTTACLGALYDIYLLSCLTTPQDYFGLVSTEQIVLFIMNITLGLSEQVAAGKINSMMETSPYFSELRKIAKENKLKTVLPKNIDIRTGSRVTHTLGQAIHCLSENTRIPIYNSNKVLTIKDIYDELSHSRNTLYTYSLDIVNKTIVPGKIIDVFDNGLGRVYRITLDNDKYVECTSNHRLLGRDNEYHYISDLSEGDTLIPFINDHQWINPYDLNKFHTIVKIEYIGLKHVYDIEVYKYHNFAIDCGIYSHNSAILSEAAFSIYNDQFMSAFNSILARQQSRFLNNGKSSGRIWVDSSEKDTGSILNSLCDRYRDKPGVIIDSGPLWEIRPWNYGTEAENNICKFFDVYKGSERETANIIEDSKEIERLSTEEPGSILIVPESHRMAFESDLDRSLRDLGGIATASKFRLFRNVKSLYSSFGYMPLFNDIIKLEFQNESDQIINYCKLPQYFINLPYKNSPRYIHVDIGVTGDKFGFAMSFISGKKSYEYTDNNTDVRDIHTTDSAITTITELAFSIQNKNGQQVPIHKVRLFINWLIEHGVPIAGVSADTFQSTSFLQEMKLLGLETSIISVDRSVDPYINLRNSIYEGRVQLPDNKLLRRELENLEVSPSGDKVDHPDEFPGTNERGSKDCADAVAASVFNCFKNQDKYSIFDILYSDVVNKEIDKSNIDTNPTPGKEALSSIYNTWKSLPDNSEDPYYEYLKSLDELNSKNKSENIYNQMFRR